MSIEKSPYQPSQKEIEKAKETMTDKQEIMSYYRDRDYNKLTKEMIENLEKGKYDLKVAERQFRDMPNHLNDTNESKLYGKIGNYNIEIKHYFWNTILGVAK